MGSVENMNKELCGLVRCFSHLLERESEAGDHDCVSIVTVVGQTLWMDLKPLRCES